MSSTPLLELHNASLYRGSSKVLHELTLTIAEGQHTAIVGPNGAGKSSLIRLLTVDSYALAPESGPPQVRILGRDRWDVSELRQELGVVSPDLQHRFTVAGRGEHDESQPVAPRLSGIEAVMTGYFGSEGLFSHQPRDVSMTARAHDALVRVGGAHLAERRVDQMSTGEARRVLIARALVHEPRALVLDEPTSGLDVIARHRFMNDIRRLASNGTTILLVTQHIEEIFPEIERVIVLQGGRIVDDGRKEAVLRGPVLPRVFGAPLRVDEIDGYFYARPAPA